MPEEKWTRSPLGSFTSKKSCKFCMLVRSYETYSEDTPYPSCLIFGRTAAERPLHIVCAPVLAEERLIITTY